MQVGEHDNDGSAVTFMVVYSLPTAKAMNTTNTNEGGWGSSAMCGYMSSYVAAGLSDTFKSAPKTVTKKAYSGSYDDGWDASGTTQDKIWLMSYSELTGITQSSDTLIEGSQYSWFSGKVTNPTGSNSAIKGLCWSRNRSAPQSIEFPYMWLRSPSLLSSNYFRDVFSNGNPGSGTANESYRPFGVCVAFYM